MPINVEHEIQANLWGELAYKGGYGRGRLEAYERSRQAERDRRADELADEQLRLQEQAADRAYALNLGQLELGAQREGRLGEQAAAITERTAELDAQDAQRYQAEWQREEKRHRERLHLEGIQDVDEYWRALMNQFTEAGQLDFPGDGGRKLDGWVRQAGAVMEAPDLSPDEKLAGLRLLTTEAWPTLATGREREPDVSQEKFDSESIPVLDDQGVETGRRYRGRDGSWRLEPDLAYEHKKALELQELKNAEAAAKRQEAESPEARIRELFHAHKAGDVIGQRTVTGKTFAGVATEEEEDVTWGQLTEEWKVRTVVEEYKAEQEALRRIAALSALAPGESLVTPPPGPEIVPDEAVEEGPGFPERLAGMVPTQMLKSVRDTVTARSKRDELARMEAELAESRARPAANVAKAQELYEKYRSPPHSLPPAEAAKAAEKEWREVYGTPPPGATR